MAAKISHGIDLMLELIDCYTCGVTFGMTSSLVQRYRDQTNASFYCPNGHAQHFTKSTQQKLDEEKAARAGDRERHERQLTWYRERKDDAERSNASLRGQITKLRKKLGEQS